LPPGIALRTPNAITTSRFVAARGEWIFDSASPDRVRRGSVRTP
jgi:hypothetical protein